MTVQEHNVSENERPYTPSQVAVLLNINPKTVTRWCDEGKLPYFKLPGGHRRIYRAEVDRIRRGEAK